MFPQVGNLYGEDQGHDISWYYMGAPAGRLDAGRRAYEERDKT